METTTRRTTIPIETVDEPLKKENLLKRIPEEDRQRFAFRTTPITGKLWKEGQVSRLVSDIKFPKTTAATDPHEKMRATVWQGADKVELISRPKVMVTEPTDALIKITSTTICGSDLHLYHAEVHMKQGDVLGHESMGIVESVGDRVTKFRAGDRVVISAIIACGKCPYCEHQLFSLCDSTNPSQEMEEQYGHRISGVFGYSHLTGGYEGCQAEYVRVPNADINLLKIPDQLPDEKALFLSDIICTGWHANELGGVEKDCSVAIWGCGPVGLMAAMWSKFRGASRIVMIDHLDYRLKFAREHLGVDIINFRTTDVYERLLNLIPGGPDVGIECVGFRFPKSVKHKLYRALKLESDDPEVLSEMIKCIRKGGTLACIGDYFGYANNFPVGALMEKSITFRGGQVFVQKYWNQLLGYIVDGRVDPSFVITHRFPLSKLADCYEMFDKKQQNVIKLMILPDHLMEATAEK